MGLGHAFAEGGPLSHLLIHLIPAFPAALSIV
jgi:hypothetical protein